MAPNRKGEFTEEWFKGWLKTNPDTGCWEWQRSVNSRKGAPGYGQFAVNYKLYFTHRVAYELWVGPIPKGLHVLHHCDNRRCCNPTHLWLGTHQDNMRDMDTKGRRSKPQPKLTHEQAVELSRRICAGERQWMIARDFGVSRSVIQRILHDCTYARYQPTTFVPYNKLTPDLAQRIRHGLTSGLRGTHLAIAYGVNKGTISRIKHNKIYR